MFNFVDELCGRSSCSFRNVFLCVSWAAVHSFVRPEFRVRSVSLVGMCSFLMFRNVFLCVSWAAVLSFVRPEFRVRSVSLVGMCSFLMLHKTNTTTRQTQRAAIVYLVFLNVPLVR